VSHITIQRLDSNLSKPLTEPEIQNQLWHWKNEINQAAFSVKLINAKISNKQFFVKNKIKHNPNELFIMNASELLFKEFFNNEKNVVVKTLNDAELQDHIEALEQFALEARARLYAADEEKRERSSKNKRFTVSGDNESLTSNAINAISERNKKISKRDKLVENMMKLIDCDRATAEAMVPDTDKMSKGRAINASEALKKLNNQLPSSQVEISAEPLIKSEPKPFSNPFAPKSVETTVSISEDKKIITITEEVEKPKTFVNPFSK
jgi:hypothetical protein